MRIVIWNFSPFRKGRKRQRVFGFYWLQYSKEMLFRIEKQIAIEKAEQQMITNGIVAVGDICNTTDTFRKSKKRIFKYYNFIEVFGVKDDLENQIDF